MSDVAFSGLPQIFQLDGTEKIPLNSNAGVTSHILSDIFLNKNYIENLKIENTTSSITIKAGLRLIAGGIFVKFDSDTSPSLTAVDALIGTGYGWCGLCVNETTGIASVQLLGAGVPAFAATSTLGIAIGTTKDTENQLNMNSVYDNTYGYCRSRINGTGDWYRIIAVFKRIVGYTDATVDSYNAAYNMDCDSTAKLTIGMSVSQASVVDIPANAEIIEITSATAFRLNVVATGTHSNISMIIASDIVMIIQIEKIPKTYIKAFHSIQPGSLATIPMPLAAIEIDINSELSGNTAARLFTAAKAKKIRYSIYVNIDTTATTSLHYIYKNGKLYLVLNWYTGAGSRNAPQHSQPYQLSKGQTLQWINNNTNGTAYNLNLYPRGIGLLIEE